VRLVMGRLFLVHGEPEKAAPLIGWAVQAARTSGGADEKPAVLSLAALGHVAAGEPGLARELLNELEQAGLQDNDNYVGSLPEMVQAALGAGDPALAERL